MMMIVVLATIGFLVAAVMYMVEFAEEVVALGTIGYLLTVFLSVWLFTGLGFVASVVTVFGSVTVLGLAVAFLQNTS